MIPLQIRCELCDDAVQLSDDRDAVRHQMSTFVATHFHDRLRISLHVPTSPIPSASTGLSLAS